MLQYNKYLVKIPVGLMLVFCVIPVQMIITFYQGDDYMTVAQLCFGYMWLWFLGLIVFWFHKKILYSDLHYIFAISALAFNALFIIFLPYLFSDAFTNLFWD